MLLHLPIDSYVKLRNLDASLCTTQTTGPSILFTPGMHLMSHFSRCCYYFMKSIELLSWTHWKMTSMVFHRMHQAEGPKRRPPGLPHHPLPYSYSRPIYTFSPKSIFSQKTANIKYKLHLFWFMIQ